MYNKLCSYENLLQAFCNARKRKRKKMYVRAFEKNLHANLCTLQQELLTQTYKPKPLKTFIIRDPKTRKISKSKFRDRVIHHAVINLIGHLFEKSFIYDSHANQIGKGTLKALERFDTFKRQASRNNTRPCYVLKADIKHYFEEVDHAILISLLRKKIKDEKVIWLIQQIIINTAKQSRRRGGERHFEITKGMPLGNLTSQFFANVYLNELDQFVKHDLKAKYYIRYVDDFVIFSHSRAELENYKQQIDKFLANKLNLELHPHKSKVCNLSQGIPFLGFKVFYYHKLPRKANVRKFQSRLHNLKLLYHERQIHRQEIIDCLEGWMAYARQGNTYLYRRCLLRKFNRSFPLRNKNEIIRTKKLRNFFRKVYASKVEYSAQKTLFFLRKGLTIQDIAKERGIKEGTVWAHLSNLIEHGQLAVWNVLPKSRVIYLLRKIRNSSVTLTELRARILLSISFDEIACVRSHVRMKEKIKAGFRKNFSK